MQKRKGYDTASPDGSGSGATADEQADCVQVDDHNSLSLDDAFDILSNQRRRYVLRYLLDNATEDVELGQLSEHIAALENDKEISTITSTERKRVYVGLYQNHLPRMDAVGIIEFDSDRKTIHMGEHGRDLERYLHLEPHEPPTVPGGEWAMYNLFVALGGSLLVGLSMLSTSILSRNQPLLVAGILACFIGLSLVQLSQHRV